MEKLKFGIIGAGLMGRRRAESLLSFPYVELVSIADIYEDKVRALSEKFKCRHTKSYMDIIKNKEINCVIISTVNNVLAKIAKEALENNKHVFVEKPVSVNTKDVEELIKISEKKNLIVKVGFNHRFFPTIQKAKELLGSGEIGELMFLKATYGQKSRIGFEKEWRVKKEISGGGELIDQGAHIIDLCLFFMGDIKEVKGVITKLFWDIEVDDNDFFILKNEMDKIAFIHTSSSLWENTFKFELHGTKGIIEVEGIRGHYGNPNLKIIRRNEEKSNKSGVYEFDKEILNFPNEDLSYVDEIGNFIRTINKNGRLSGDLHDAKRVIEIISELYEGS